VGRILGATPTFRDWFASAPKEVGKALKVWRVLESPSYEKPVYWHYHFSSAEIDRKRRQIEEIRQLIDEDIALG